MKNLIALGALFVIFCDVAIASPLINHVNDVDDFNEISPSGEIKEQIDDFIPKHRWELIPDTEGRMHLIDMNSYEPSIEPFFDAEVDMKFILTTRIRTEEKLNMSIDSIEASSFDKSHPTRFTIHGWNGDLTSSVNAKVTEMYLKFGNFNCITVDWSLGAGTYDYIKARNRIHDVAKYAAKFIDFLHEHGYLKLEELHLIGHSLGGHAAGLVGKFVTKGVVQAIFALDPAGPLFSIDKPSERISADDGAYVEVMHTNGGILGFGKPLGKTDFYPNFGRWQPGCGLDLTGSCSHGRAPEYFAESIINNGFVAMKCKSYDEVQNGQCTEIEQNRYLMRPEPANYNLEGILFLKTNGNPPFATFVVP